MTDQPFPGFWAKVEHDYAEIRARIEHLPPVERHAVMDMLNAHRARAVTLRQSAMDFADKLDALVDRHLAATAKSGRRAGSADQDVDWLLTTALGAQLTRDFAAGIAPNESMAKQLSDQRTRPPAD